MRKRLTTTVGGNTIIQLIGKAASTLLGVGAIMIMTRTLGAEQFGWYTTATSWLQFIAILGDFGFTLTTAAMLSEPLFDKTRVFNTLFTWRFITALTLHGLAAISIWFFPYPLPVKIATGILAISFLAFALIQVFTGYFQARLYLLPITIGELLSRTILVFGTWKLAQGENAFLPIMALISIGACAYLGFVFYQSTGVALLIDREISRVLFRRMWPTALSIIFNAIYLQGDRVLLPLYVSQTDIGFYGAAYRVLDIITQSAAIVMGILTPLLAFAWSRRQTNQFSHLLKTSTSIMALVFLPMTAGVFCLAHPIMNAVAGSNFAGSGTILRGLCVAVIGIMLGMTFGHVLLATDFQRQALLVYASDAVLSIVGYLFLIPLFGMWGAIFVTVASEFYAGFGLMLLAIFYTKTTPDFRMLAIILAATSIMILGLLYLPPSTPLALTIFLGMILYGSTLLLFGLRPHTFSTVSIVD